mmetsp:Transcript_391/g.1344  ORF Transcript_391/g.1344 Transcript_391/m.1344 type:complete len:224 (+) Transcript_391:191-862(+)
MLCWNVEPCTPFLHTHEKEWADIIPQQSKPRSCFGVVHLSASPILATGVATVDTHGPKVHGATLWRDHRTIHRDLTGATLVGGWLSHDRRNTEYHTALVGRCCSPIHIAVFLEVDLPSIHVCLSLVHGRINVDIVCQLLVQIVGVNETPICHICSQHCQNKCYPHASRQGNPNSDSTILPQLLPCCSRDRNACNQTKDWPKQESCPPKAKPQPKPPSPVDNRK